MVSVTYVGYDAKVDAQLEELAKKRGGHSTASGYGFGNFRDVDFTFPEGGGCEFQEEAETLLRELGVHEDQATDKDRHIPMPPP